MSVATAMTMDDQRHLINNYDKMSMQFEQSVNVAAEAAAAPPNPSLAAPPPTSADVQAATPTPVPPQQQQQLKELPPQQQKQQPTTTQAAFATEKSVEEAVVKEAGPVVAQAAAVVAGTPAEMVTESPSSPAHHNQQLQQQKLQRQQQATPTTTAAAAEAATVVATRTLTEAAETMAPAATSTVTEAEVKEASVSKATVVDAEEKLRSPPSVAERAAAKRAELSKPEQQTPPLTTSSPSQRSKPAIEQVEQRAREVQHATQKPAKLDSKLAREERPKSVHQPLLQQQQQQVVKPEHRPKLPQQQHQQQLQSTSQQRQHYASSSSKVNDAVAAVVAKQRQRQLEEDVERLKLDKHRLSQQCSDAQRREKILLRRLAIKEQEFQDYVNQIAEYKAAQAPSTAALRSALLDPAVNLIFEKLKKELKATKAKLEETQNELSAWKFTPDSNTGKRLMAKCRLLYQENEELGKMTSNGRLAKLETELAMQKSFSEEVKKSQSELDDFLQELDEDVEGMQSTILYLQQELKVAHERVQALERENFQLKAGPSDAHAQGAVTLAGEDVKVAPHARLNGDLIYANLQQYPTQQEQPQLIAMSPIKQEASAPSTPMDGGADYADYGRFNGHDENPTPPPNDASTPVADECSTSDNSNNSMNGGQRAEVAAANVVAAVSRKRSYEEDVVSSFHHTPPTGMVGGVSTVQQMAPRTLPPKKSKLHLASLEEEPPHITPEPCRQPPTPAGVSTALDETVVGMAGEGMALSTEASGAALSANSEAMAAHRVPLRSGGSDSNH